MQSFTVIFFSQNFYLCNFLIHYGDHSDHCHGTEVPPSHLFQMEEISWNKCNRISVPKGTFTMTINLHLSSITYSTIEAKEATNIGYNWFLFFYLSMKAEKETCYIQYGQLFLFQ